MDQEELKGLLASVKEITEQNKRILAENAELKGLLGDPNGNSRVLKRVTQRVVEVRMIDGKVAIGYVNHGTATSPSFWYKKPNPKDPKEMIDMVDVILEGASVPLSIGMSEFRKESTRVKCKVMKTDEKEHTVNQGVVKKREVEEYSSIELDFDVPLDVVHKSYFYTVEIPKDFGGIREVVVGESMVNLA